MFRSELPRLYELRDCLADPTAPDAYFQNFEETVTSSAHIRAIYLRWETTLGGLDQPAWST